MRLRPMVPHNLGPFPKNSMVLWLHEKGRRTPLRLYIKDEEGLHYREFQQITVIKNKKVETLWKLTKVAEPC